MVRASQLLHAQREPAVPRPAATVLLLRDAPQGIEVLMTRRSATRQLRAGRLRLSRRRHRCRRRAGARHRRAPAHAGRRAADAGHRRHPRKLRGAGRPAGAPPRRPPGSTRADIAALDRHQPLRRAMPRRAAWCWRPTRSSCSRTGSPTATCRAASTCPSWSRACREGQTPVADEAEQFEPVWVRPADALARHEAGSFFMIFPTIRTLERLAKFDDRSTRCSQACAGEQPLWTSCPRAGLLKGAEARYMEHEMAYGELALVSPDGQLVHHLDWHTRPARGAAEERDAHDGAQPRRDDRPRHQQLPRRRPGHRLHRDRPGPERCRNTSSGSGAPPAATSA